MTIFLNYIFLFLYIISYSIGISSFIFTLLYYNLERVMWLKYYLIFLSMFSILFFIKTLKLYTYITLPDFLYSGLFESLVLFSIIFVISFMIYIIPAFLYNFLKIKWSTKLSVIFLSLSIFYFLIGILAILVTNKLYILSVVLFYSIMVYLFIVGIKNYKNIAEASAKFILKILSFISFITLVLALTQFFKSSSIDIYDNFNIIDIIFLLSYLWFNIVMLSYFFWYFLNIISKKNIAVSMKSGENNYIEVLTKREKEITNYLLEGKSNKEVSIILHISLNTVNNHVSKIYEKINVKNRVEFVNKFIK